MAAQGRKDRAKELLGNLLAIRNDVGLLSGEYDTVNKRMLGNFPQAFSHIGLVNAALACRDESPLPTSGAGEAAQT